MPVTKEPCMRLGLSLRNMGPQSTVAMRVECARAAEAAGIDDLWAAGYRGFVVPYRDTWKPTGLAPGRLRMGEGETP